MRVERESEPGPDWDAYVESHPDAALGHASAWSRILREGYGLESRFLSAKDEAGRLCGVLPLVQFRSLRGQRELLSLPFLDVAGVLASSPEAEGALVRAALEETRRAGARFLELRMGTPLTASPTHGEGVPRVNLVLRLEADEESQWKAVRAKVRNQTRRAEKEGLTLGEGSPEALLDAFYGPFSRNMRDLGSPVHARSFFAAIAREFGERMRFIDVMDGERPVGGLVAIHYAGRVTVPWASTLREERRRCPNNLIYWEALRWAVARGAGHFDFGRSPIDGGTYRFKKGWGAEEHALHWSRMDADGSAQAIETAGQNPLLARLSSWWTRLPVPVATWLGPRLRGRISS